MYDDGEMKILTCMLSGVDVADVCSPIEDNVSCNMFGLIPGGSFDLRDGYDLLGGCFGLEQKLLLSLIKFL